MNTIHLEGIKALILDMDGVLWSGDTPIGDLPAIFRKLRQKGCRFVLASNNSTSSVDQFLEKLARLSVTLESWQIVNSSEAVVAHLYQRHPDGGPVYIIGESGLIDTLAQAGFYQSEQQVAAVIVGLDRDLTYEKLCTASLLIRAGAPFLGTNPDPTLPVKNSFIPGAGAILAALEAATGVKPQIIGKPAPEMYRVALQRLGTTPVETLVVGDRLDTDIAGAQELGYRTALVLSGATSAAVASAWNPPPDLIVQDLTHLVEYL